MKYTKQICTIDPCTLRVACTCVLAPMNIPWRSAMRAYNIARHLVSIIKTFTQCKQLKK